MTRLDEVPDCGAIDGRRDGEYSYELVHSKTNQSGEDRSENEKPVVGAAADVLRDWLQAAGIKEEAMRHACCRSATLECPDRDADFIGRHDLITVCIYSLSRQARPRKAAAHRPGRANTFGGQRFA